MIQISEGRWNALSAGDRVVRRHDESTWEVTGVEPCARTVHGSKAIVTLRRVSEEVTTCRDHLFWSEAK